MHEELSTEYEPYALLSSFLGREQYCLVQTLSSDGRLGSETATSHLVTLGWGVAMVFNEGWCSLITVPASLLL